MMSATAEASTTINVPVSADAHILSAYPTRNKGTKSYLEISNSPRTDTLLKFNVSGVGTGIVRSAKIRLVPAGSASVGGEFHSATSNNWSETLVTWANAPSASSTIIAKQGAITQGNPVFVDVTSAIQKDGTYSFRVLNTVKDNAPYDYYSRESSSQRAPVLILTVDSSTATPTPAPTASPTPVPVQSATPTPTPAPSPTPAPTPMYESCLTQSGPLVSINGPQSAAYRQTSLAASTKIDSRTATWNGVAWTPVRVGGGDHICSSGGIIQGSWNPYTTPWTTYHDTYAYEIYGNNMIVENMRVDDYGDSFMARDEITLGNNFTIRGNHVTHGHDDCVQDDGMKSGAILDNLFDGCYVFFSARGFGSGPSNVVRVENNLVRLEGTPTYYNGQASDPYDPTQYKHGGFWKIDEFDKAPKLSIHNNIFRADSDSHTWIPLMPDARSISSCSNNIIVWLGSGPFPEQVPACFTLTTDKSVWDNAVAKWKVNHSN